MFFSYTRYNEHKDPDGEEYMTWSQSQVEEKLKYKGAWHKNQKNNVFKIIYLIMSFG